MRYLAMTLVFCAFFATACSAGDEPASPAEVVQEETTSASSTL